MTQRILVELNVQNILHKTEVFIEDNKEEQVEFNVNSKYEVRLLIHVKGHSFISFYKWKASRKQYFIDKRIIFIITDEYSETTDKQPDRRILAEGGIDSDHSPGNKSNS